MFNQFITSNSKVVTEASSKRITLVGKVALAACVCAILASCAGTRKPIKGPSTNITQEQKLQLDRFIANLDSNLNDIWGINEIFFKPTDLVKYSDNYYTRAVINFADGIMKFESVNPAYYTALRNEIIYTVLMSESPKDGKLYNDDLPSDDGRTPFLANQLVDQNKQPIKTLEQAEAFANYLISNFLQTRRLENGELIYYIQVNLLKNHIKTRSGLYSDLIYKWASEYNIDPKLIFAIMQQESAFNPYAVSRSGAIGLMQVVPRTAGADIYKLWGYEGKPTSDFLFDPNNNIHAGVTYFWILQNRYFQNVRNPLTQRYLMIASYNAGAGGTLSIFSRNRDEAINIINNMTPQEVYDFIIRRHYSAETRDYLFKVSRNYRNY